MTYEVMIGRSDWGVMVYGPDGDWTSWIAGPHWRTHSLDWIIQNHFPSYVTGGLLGVIVDDLKERGLLLM